MPEDPADNQRNPHDGCNDCKGSGAGTLVVEFHSGAVVETHNLVTYQSLGSVRGLTLTYDSERADARPIVHFGYDNVMAGEIVVDGLSGDQQVTSNIKCLGMKVGNLAEMGVSISGLSHRTGCIDAALQADLRG